SEISLHVRCHRRMRRSHAVDDGVGEPRQRHPGGIYDVVLRLPLRGERLGQGVGGSRERTASGRLHRAAIESNPEVPVPTLDLDPFREATAQLRPHGAARDLRGIERLVAKNAIEQVAHSAKMGGAQQLCNVSMRAKARTRTRTPIAMVAWAFAARPAAN